MGRTIRIDDEVFAWLQQQGETFVDTPNSVLRRLAGLEHAADMEHERVAKHPAAPKAHTRRSAPRRPVQITGKQLNEEWSVGAKHALFHRNGRWYNNLERFPGALFDPKGYIVFESEEQYRSCPGVRVTQETNVPDGISSLQGYVQVRREGNNLA